MESASIGTGGGTSKTVTSVNWGNIEELVFGGKKQERPAGSFTVSEAIENTGWTKSRRRMIERLNQMVADGKMEKFAVIGESQCFYRVRQ